MMAQEQPEPIKNAEAQQIEDTLRTYDDIFKTLRAVRPLVRSQPEILDLIS